MKLAWARFALTDRDEIFSYIEVDNPRAAAEIDERIARLEALRDKLDGCIGCGCLSLDKCALWNPGDVAARHGAGPRWLMGDRHEPG